jgi:3-hydroxyisobutyrate dehydrogenase/2-hydroxy-3-oxopropionate reductase
MPGFPLIAPAQLAVVGLGALGLPMAINLREAGYRLHVHTRSRIAESDPSLQAGDSSAAAVCCASPAAAAGGCQALLLCVSDDAAVEAVLWGEHGAGFALAPGSLVIDCSTIAPATAEAMAEAAGGTQRALHRCACHRRHGGRQRPAPSPCSVVAKPRHWSRPVRS